MAKNRIKKPKPKNTKHIEFKEEHPDYDDYKPIFSFCHMKYVEKSIAYRGALVNQNHH